jgi:hypothetical protein
VSEHLPISKDPSPHRVYRPSMVPDARPSGVPRGLTGLANPLPARAGEITNNNVPDYAHPDHAPGLGGPSAGPALAPQPLVPGPLGTVSGPRPVPSFAGFGDSGQPFQRPDPNVFRDRRDLNGTGTLPTLARPGRVDRTAVLATTPPGLSIKPTFGVQGVTTTDGSSTSAAALKTPPVYVVFEGTNWTGGPSMVDRATPLAQAAQRIMKGGYLSALGQYGFRGIANASTLNNDWWVDTTHPTINSGSSDTDLQPFLDDLVASHGLSISTNPDQQPIFVVVTPTAGGGDGFNRGGPTLKNGARAHMVFVDVPTDASGAPSKDGFTDLFSHELAECISNKLQVKYPDYKLQTPDPTQLIFDSPTVPPGSTQIADGEADFGRYQGRDNDGDIVQAYWSDSAKAFVIPNAPRRSGYAHWSAGLDSKGNRLGTVDYDFDASGSEVGVKLFDTPQPVPGP